MENPTHEREHEPVAPDAPDAFAFAFASASASVLPPLPDLGDPWKLSAEEEAELDWGQAHELVRGKWMLDGARSVSELVDRLLDMVERYRKMAREGWELIAPVYDDTGYLRPPELRSDDSGDGDPSDCE